LIDNNIVILQPMSDPAARPRRASAVAAATAITVIAKQGSRHNDDESTDQDDDNDVPTQPYTSSPPKGGSMNNRIQPSNGERREPILISNGIIPLPSSPLRIPTRVPVDLPPSLPAPAKNDKQNVPAVVPSANPAPAATVVPQHNANNNNRAPLPSPAATPVPRNDGKENDALSHLPLVQIHDVDLAITIPPVHGDPVDCRIFPWPSYDEHADNYIPFITTDMDSLCYCNECQGSRSQSLATRRLHANRRFNGKFNWMTYRRAYAAREAFYKAPRSQIIATPAAARPPPPSMPPMPPPPPPAAAAAAAIAAAAATAAIAAANKERELAAEIARLKSIITEHERRPQPTSPVAPSAANDAWLNWNNLRSMQDAIGNPHAQQHTDDTRNNHDSGGDDNINEHDGAGNVNTNNVLPATTTLPRAHEMKESTFFRTINRSTSTTSDNKDPAATRTTKTTIDHEAINDSNANMIVDEFVQTVYGDGGCLSNYVLTRMHPSLHRPRSASLATSTSHRDHMRFVTKPAYDTARGDAVAIDKAFITKAWDVFYMLLRKFISLLMIDLFPDMKYHAATLMRAPTAHDESSRLGALITPLRLEANRVVRGNVRTQLVMDRMEAADNNDNAYASEFNDSGHAPYYPYGRGGGRRGNYNNHNGQGGYNHNNRNGNYNPHYNRRDNDSNNHNNNGNNNGNNNNNNPNAGRGRGRGNARRN
jgi:hypothetical protein